VAGPERLTEDERRLVKRNLGFSSRRTRWRRTTLCSAPTVTSPRRNAGNTSCARRSRRPSIPTPTSTCREPAPGRGRGLHAYHEIPSIRDKDEFLIPFIDILTDPTFRTGTPEADQKLLRSLIVFACVMEACSSTSASPRFGARPAEQDDRLGRAVSVHPARRVDALQFGIDLINQIKMENPHLWTPEFREEIQGLIKKAVELEYRYAEEHHAARCLGSTLRCSRSTCAHCQSPLPADRVDQMFPGASNPFPWMSEMTDLKKERNFFETRVIEYQTGGALSWE